MPDPIGTGNNPYDPRSGTQTGTGSAVMPIYGRPSGWADPTYQGNGMYDYPNYMGPWDNPYKYDPRRFSMGYGQPPQQQSWGYGQQGWGQPLPMRQGSWGPSPYGDISMMGNVNPWPQSQQNWGSPQQQGYGGYGGYGGGYGAAPPQQVDWTGWQTWTPEQMERAISANSSFLGNRQTDAEIGSRLRDQNTQDYQWGTEWGGNRADTAWTQGFKTQEQADLVANRAQMAKQAEIDSQRNWESAAVSALGRRNYGNVRYSW